MQLNRIALPIFIITIIVILLVYTPIIFPALFSSLVGNYSDEISATFEFGHHALILIISNIIIISIGIAYYRKKLPNQLQNIIEKIRLFEISKRNTLIILLL